MLEKNHVVKFIRRLSATLEATCTDIVIARDLVGENELLLASEWNNQAESCGTGEIVSGQEVVKLSSATFLFSK